MLDITYFSGKKFLCVLTSPTRAVPELCRVDSQAIVLNKVFFPALHIRLPAKNNLKLLGCVFFFKGHRTESSTGLSTEYRKTPCFPHSSLETPTSIASARPPSLPLPLSFPSQALLARPGTGDYLRMVIIMINWKLFCTGMCPRRSFVCFLGTCGTRNAIATAPALPGLTAGRAPTYRGHSQPNLRFPVTPAGCYADPHAGCCGAETR